MSKKMLEWSSRLSTPCQRGLQRPKWNNAELPKSIEDEPAKTAVAMRACSSGDKTIKTMPAAKLSGKVTRCSQPRR